MAVDVTMHAHAAAPRPRFWSVLWRVGLSWLFAYYATSIVAAVAGALAFAGDHWGNASFPWFVAPVDAWSGVANVPLGMLWLGIALGLSRRSLVEAGEGLTVAFPWLAGVTAAAALVQIFAVETNADGERPGGLAVLLVATYVLRRVPWIDYRPLLSRRDVLTALLLATALVGGAALAYASLRPLEAQTSGCEPRCGGEFGELLQNRGRDAMTVTAVSAAGVARGVRVRVGERAGDRLRFGAARLPRRLAPGARLELAVRTRGACEEPGAVFDALVVTYTRGGSRHTALVTPTTPATCR